MPRYQLFLDSATGRTIADDGSPGGIQMSSSLLIADSRLLTELDNGRQLTCLVNATLTIPSGLSAGWVCLVTPVAGGVTFACGAGVTINGSAAPVVRANVLLNRVLSLIQTAPNTYTATGV